MTPISSNKSDPEEIKQHAKILFNRISKELDYGIRKLPSFPPIAKRVGDLIKDPNYKARDLIEVLEGDKKLSERLVKISSSSLYPGKEQCDQLGAAVRRMGADTTRNLVLMYSLDAVFRSDKRLAQQKLKQLWAKSAKLSAIAYWIATYSVSFKSEAALLAGLLQDVGSLYIVSTMSEKAKSEYHWQLVDQMLEDYSTEMTIKILNHWQISEEIITCAKTKDNWMRNGNDRADLADLMTIARYHSYLNTDKIRECPKFSNMPCVAKVKMRKPDMTPFQGLKIVNESKEAISDIARMLVV